MCFCVCSVKTAFSGAGMPFPFRHEPGASALSRRFEVLFLIEPGSVFCEMNMLCYFRAPLEAFCIVMLHFPCSTARMEGSPGPTLDVLSASNTHKLQ